MHGASNSEEQSLGVARAPLLQIQWRIRNPVWTDGLEVEPDGWVTGVWLR